MGQRVRRRPGARMRTLVLGLGESGLALARWLAREGEVRVADTRATPPMLAALRDELPQVPFVAGFSESLLDGVTRIAISPGLSPTQAPTQPLLAAAKVRGIDVVGEIELFALALARLHAERGYTPKIVGITGTNGKTTTTRLAGLLIERSGRSVAVAGNVAPSALDSLRRRLAADDLPEVWVLELSSFQLATTRSLMCDAAAVLNITQDHLDWHGTMEAYVRAKARILAPGTKAVLNRDDPLVFALASKKHPPITFGAGAPTHGIEYGLVRDGALTWLALAEDVAPPARRRATASGAVSLSGDAPQHAPQHVPQYSPQHATEVFVQRLMPIDALHPQFRARGRHNVINVLAAFALARAIGWPLAPLLRAVREYAGEPHRVERVATLDGVTYYDDSKGTNVGATVAAIEGLGSDGRRLAVILGGDGKGQDFSPLVAPLAAHARAVALIGRDGARIGELLRDAPYPVLACESLAAAVSACASAARAGGAVVLSPACASLSRFRNYAHRSEVFIAAVNALAARAGSSC